MDTIRQYIVEDVLKKRMNEKGVLVVFDPDQTYEALCVNLGEDVCFIDTSLNPLEVRLDVFEALNSAINGGQRLLIYIRDKLALDEESLQVNPFSSFIKCGSVFPEGDGDSFLNLCLKACPNDSVRIRKIFSDVKGPTLSMLESSAEQGLYPILRDQFKVSSIKDILLNLLITKQHCDEPGWIEESKEFFESCLSFNLLSRSSALKPIQEELWRFLLFSEFTFDLPTSLPVELSSIPVAQEHAKPFIYEVLSTLRNDLRYQNTYVEYAENIEKEMNLASICSNINDLGERETFPFEERTFLLNILNKYKDGDLDSARAAIGKRYQSVWSIKGESQILWTVVESSIKLIDVCSDLSLEYLNHTENIGSIIDFYVDRFREADRYHREFEQSVSDMVDNEKELAGIIDSARSRYRKLAGNVHDAFIRNFKKEGWPSKKHYYNSEIYRRIIDPALKQSGKKIAYFHIDALRYELGVVLEKELMNEGKTSLDVSYAQLPTVTFVGMTSLLPNADTKLELRKESNNAVLYLDGVKINDVSKRMKVFKDKLGDRFEELTIDEFNKPRKKVSDSVNLLVLRDTDIDSFLENDPTALLPMVYRALKKIRVAINKLKKLKFDEVVISTDHGFFLNGEYETGDKCPTPNGSWINLHNRIMLGDGVEDSSNFIISTDKVDIKGDFNSVASPKSLVTYRKGESFFHGGISLQECILPLLRVKLSDKSSKGTKLNLNVTYKNGSKKITTRVPVFTLEYISDDQAMDLFGQIEEAEVLFEAHDLQGNVVGEAKLGGAVNSATRIITISKGARMQVALKMQLDFEGEFIVRALNPNTLLKYTEIKLKTDYMV
ncbi:MAG: PglZ domain-containing protein [Bacteriovoracaceae bacterium]|jgi:hypothetical protein|nr:PglZ domain-containing protein [Bacteriovoracaceae bacterium]